MYKKLAFGLVILFGLLVMSCDPDDGINGDNGSETLKNYWERNAWTHLQLKGKVKSVREAWDDSDTYYETHFGEQGQILKTVYRHQNEEPRVTVFEYNSLGQLVNDGDGTYEYGNHGKYVPRDFFHINMAGLVKNLIKVDDFIKLEFEGDNLYVFWGDEPDPLVVKYTGDYPTKINDVTTPDVEYGTFMNASYQANGMWDVFEEGFFATKDNVYIDSRKYYYKKDNEFMLLDRVVMSTTGASGLSIYETKYFYNDQKDLIRVHECDEEGIPFEEAHEYYEYEYDAKGNWTKQTFRYSSRDNTSTMYRDIEYFD